MATKAALMNGDERAESEEIGIVQAAGSNLTPNMAERHRPMDRLHPLSERRARGDAQGGYAFAQRS